MTTTNNEEKLAKSILFRGKVKGEGIVNYDSIDQKYYMNRTDNYTINKDYKNIKYAKKVFRYKDAEKYKLDYDIKISSNCARHEIFKESFMFQSPNIMHNKQLLLLAIANPASLLRGFCYLEQNNSNKRTSAVSIEPLIQISNSKSFIEQYSRSGEKIIDEDESDNTYFFKETVGDIEYKLGGSINLNTLQFFSCDVVFDRLGLSYDLLNDFITSLKRKMPNLQYENGYFQIMNSDVLIPELGIKFSNETVNDLIRDFFRRLLLFNIVKSDAWAKIDTLEYKIVYDVIKDNKNSEEGWITITDSSEFKDINIKDFYELVDEKKAKSLREDIIEVIAAKKAEKTKIKDANNSDSETTVKPKKTKTK